MDAINPTATKIEAQPGPQHEFLSSPADVVFYGGAAGGGKTFGVLLEATRYIKSVRGFGAVVFRRESTQVTNEGGLWDESADLYPGLGGDPRAHRLEWVFPPYSNKISFRHMQRDGDYIKYQGAQIPLIVFDELTHFIRKQFFYLLSRNRSTCGVRPYVRCTYNPVPADDPVGGWIHDFVGWYLDADGYPDPAKSGVIRWFVNLNDELFWFDTRSAAVEYAVSRGLPADIPKSFTYIAASVYDNKILLDIDPAYIANLFALSNVDQERLLHANHKIRPAAGKVFNEAWFKTIPTAAVPWADLVGLVRFWDVAATAKQRIKDDPDFTAGVLMATDKQKRVYILDCVAAQLDDDGRDAMITATAAADALRAEQINTIKAKEEVKGRVTCRQLWEKQPAAAGKTFDRHMYALLSGYSCASVPKTGDKVMNAGPYAGAVKGGRVFVVEGKWSQPYINEHHQFPEGGHDDRVDASSGAYNALNKVSTGSRVR